MRCKNKGAVVLGANWVGPSKEEPPFRRRKMVGRGTQPFFEEDWWSIEAAVCNNKGAVVLGDY